MARPKEALISRRRSLETALKIIDEEGLGALSIRRLADELGVNGASLYHHFENKDAIVTGAAQLALAEVRAPDVGAGSWREWLPNNAKRLRAALLAHPELIQVIVAKRSIDVGPRELETSAAHLIGEGVPSAAVMPLIESLELIAIGSALHETKGAPSLDDQAALQSSEDYPVLAKALRDRGLTSEEMFDVVTASIVRGVEEAIKERQARWLPAGVVTDGPNST
ncbi:hypothetical protein MANY_39510 [Mycolicibacterium anyangense]|uniref:HTH tetR-type domain-containing protein n=1 Tax=Mycolicibacterium anyangense TaxID=1431246 RepID=A0A6N4WEU1_9MYCO|nr:TetR family transcriptional regulator [Mycolicibacterium anyangense]BBZ78614.1 hypothetical protein MANY_39510 [Mycolicibacterium anyangense]